MVIKKQILKSTPKKPMRPSFNLSTLCACLFLLCLSFSACQGDVRGYVLKGTITNLKDRHILFVKDYRDSVVVDSVLADADGSFKLRGGVDSLMVGTLFIDGGKSRVTVAVNSGWTVKAEGDATMPDLIEVHGGQVNDDVSKFKSENKALLSERAAIVRKMSMVKPGSGLVGLVKKMGVVDKKFQDKVGAFVQNNLGNIASLVLIRDYLRGRDYQTVKHIDRLLQMLEEPASKSVLNYELMRFVADGYKTQPGSFAPFFELKNFNSFGLSLNSFRGRYLLLSFTADTCASCDRNKQELKKIHQDTQGRALAILEVVVSRKDKPAAKKTPSEPLKLSDINDNWRTFTPEDGWAAKILADYGIDELPTNILIDFDSKIVAREHFPSFLVPKLVNLPPAAPNSQIPLPVEIPPTPPQSSVVSPVPPSGPQSGIGHGIPPGLAPDGGRGQYPPEGPAPVNQIERLRQRAKRGAGAQ